MRCPTKSRAIYDHRIAIHLIRVALKKREMLRTMVTCTAWWCRKSRQINKIFAQKHSVDWWLRVWANQCPVFHPTPPRIPSLFQPSPTSSYRHLETTQKSGQTLPLLAAHCLGKQFGTTLWSTWTNIHTQIYTCIDLRKGTCNLAIKLMSYV